MRFYWFFFALCELVLAAALDCPLGVLISGRIGSNSLINGLYKPLSRAKDLFEHRSYFNSVQEFYLFYHVNYSSWHIYHTWGSSTATAYANDRGWKIQNGTLDQLEWKVWTEGKHMADQNVSSVCNQEEYSPGIHKPSQVSGPSPEYARPRRLSHLVATHLTYKEYKSSLIPPGHASVGGSSPAGFDWNLPNRVQRHAAYVTPRTPPGVYKNDSWTQSLAPSRVPWWRTPDHLAPEILGPRMTPRKSIIPGVSTFAPMKTPRFHLENSRAPVRHQTVEQADADFQMEPLIPLISNNDSSEQRKEDSSNEKPPTIKGERIRRTRIPLSWIFGLWGIVGFILWTMNVK